MRLVELQMSNNRLYYGYKFDNADLTQLCTRRIITVSTYCKAVTGCRANGANVGPFPAF